MPSFQSVMLHKLISLYRRKSTTSIEQLRIDRAKISRFFPLPPATEVKPTDADGVAAEWIIPSGIASNHVILYLHGGAFVMGLNNMHRAFAARLAAASGAQALLIEYRLAPEFPFPAALDDALATYRWLLRRKRSSQHIVIAGSSAGGNLALATMLALRDVEEPLPAAAICLSPVTDMEQKGESFRTRAEADPMLTRRFLKPLLDAYIGKHDPRMPLLSPILADLHRLPPMQILVGTNEILLSDSTVLAKRALEAGISVALEVGEGMWHGWPLVPVLPEARAAIKKMGRFARQHLRSMRSCNG
jgi:monoterpene epsilon-lactone hydrolase